MASATYYIVSPFGPTKDVVDVTVVDDQDALIAPMGLPVRIPSGAPIRGQPKTLSALITAKANGLLASVGGFSNVILNPCLSVVGSGSTPGVDVAMSYNCVYGNGYVNHKVLGGVNPGALTFQATSLVYAPATCIMVWEVYSTAMQWIPGSMVPGELTKRQCIPQPTNAFDCEVSFNNGATSTLLGSGVVANIPGFAQGTAMVVTFTNQFNAPVYLGSWALLY